MWTRDVKIDDPSISICKLGLVKSKLLINGRTKFEIYKGFLSKAGNQTSLQEHVHTSMLALRDSDESQYTNYTILPSDGRSIDSYRYLSILENRYWKVSISTDTFFWYRYFLIDTLFFDLLEKLFMSFPVKNVKFSC